jgi:hypothetical protein
VQKPERENRKMSKTKADKLFELYKEDRVGVIKNITKAAKCVPMDPSSANKLVKRWEKGEGGRRKKKHGRKIKGGGGIEAFEKLYDDDVIIPEKIENGIEEFLYDEDGSPDWLYDAEFRELCGVSVSKWRRYADDYKHLQVPVKGDLIWAHPGIVDELRRRVRK